MQRNISSTGWRAAPKTATERGAPKTRRDGEDRRGSDQRGRREQQRALAEYHAAVWALAIAAGFVVAVCYVELSRVEVGPQTGNTIATGVQLGQSGVAATFTHVVAVVAFFLGVTVGVVIAEECARHFFRRVLALTLVVELAPLVAFAIWGTHLSARSRLHTTSHWQLDALVALPALAMGLQTAALRRVGGQTSRTVYMTGNLSRWAEESVRYAYWSRDRKHGEREPPWRNEPSLRRIALLAGIVVAYAAGAILGGWLDDRWHLVALAVPLAALALVAIVDVALNADPPAR